MPPQSYVARCGDAVCLPLVASPALSGRNGLAPKNTGRVGGRRSAVSAGMRTLGSSRSAVELWWHRLKALLWVLGGMGTVLARGTFFYPMDYSHVFDPGPAVPSLLHVHLCHVVYPVVASRTV